MIEFHADVKIVFPLICKKFQLPVDIDSVNRIGPWKPFAEMQLVQARISFDSFIDGQSELDLICEQTGLTDKRICEFLNLLMILNFLGKRCNCVFSVDEKSLPQYSATTTEHRE